MQPQDLTNLTKGHNLDNKDPIITQIKYDSSHLLTNVSWNFAEISWKMKDEFCP